MWVDDARKVAEAIYKGSEIPPFIRSLVADPHRNELPDPEQYIDHSGSDEDDGEHLLPLEYNDQQEEIVKKLGMGMKQQSAMENLHGYETGNGGYSQGDP